MVSEPNEFYGPNTAGPDGAVSVEIFSDGTAKTVFADADMAWAADFATKGQAELKVQARIDRQA